MKDHFSERAAEYAVYRPRYPAELFAFIAASAPRHELAWDCGTGNGQAALGLTAHFQRVIATDASPDQIDNAEAHARVRYRVAPAEASGLTSGSIDAVVVAQALHWLELPAFYGEVRRVLAPGGLIAVWCYGFLSVAPDLDAILKTLYAETLGPHWPAERRHVESGYRTLAFPFAEIQVPAFEMRALLDLPELTGYLRTWSAAVRYQQASGFDAIAQATPDLERRWGDPRQRRTVRWPLTIRAGYAKPKP